MRRPSPSRRRSSTACGSRRCPPHAKRSMEPISFARSPRRESRCCLGNGIAPGAHINAVGGYRPTVRELDGAAVARSRLFVDRREQALSEAGEFLMAREEGLVGDNHIRGEIGELLLGTVQGRSSTGEITLFKSLGLGIEDLAARGACLCEGAVSRRRGCDRDGPVRRSGTCRDRRMPARLPNIVSAGWADHDADSLHGVVPVAIQVPGRLDRLDVARRVRCA